MPPLPSQKGTGKKGGRDPRQSRSRNTTPSSLGRGASVTASDTDTAYLDLPISSFRATTYDELVEQHNISSIPDAKGLKAFIERMESYLDVIETRGKVCDRGMRMLAGLRKSRIEEDEVERRRNEEYKDRSRREAADDEEHGRHSHKRKRRREELLKAKESRPLTHGAHGLAPQDGSNADHGSPSKRRSVTPARKISRESASSSLSPVEASTPVAAGAAAAETEIPNAVDADISSDDEHQPPPAPAIIQSRTFGDDPSTFPDPTCYEIREVTPDMSEDEIKEIYGVARYPKNDLHDLIPGTPPDCDFSSAKPANQVQANTFATFLEPYFRSLTEEDMAFLRERGDRLGPFVIPPRGKRHYTESWAEEDGTTSFELPHHLRDRLPENQGRGNIEQMSDSVAETEQLSTGPVASRLLALMRPENRSSPNENGVNGTSNGDLNAIIDGDAGESGTQGASDPTSLPPACQMPESNTEAWKKAVHPKLDHAQVDERIKQELRFMGFLDTEQEPSFEGHFDDEIAARQRYLQAELKRISIENGVRKRIVAERAKEAMAHQEWANILDDLGTQVQTAYIKRTRSVGKSKKTKRPGGAGGGSHLIANGGGGGGMARPAIGDNTKILMNRRKEWRDTLSPIFDNAGLHEKVPRAKDKGSSIFGPEVMAEYMMKERESWDEDEGAEEE